MTYTIEYLKVTALSSGQGKARQGKRGKEGGVKGFSWGLSGYE